MPIFFVKLFQKYIFFIWIKNESFYFSAFVKSHFPTLINYFGENVNLDYWRQLYYASSYIAQSHFFPLPLIIWKRFYCALQNCKTCYIWVHVIESTFWIEVQIVNLLFSLFYVMQFEELSLIGFSFTITS